MTLMENVKHHVQEEEKEMFPEAEQRLGPTLQEIRAKMMERKEALIKRMARSTAGRSSRARTTGGSRSRATRARSTGRSR